jgi:nitrogen fixation/metabolism regulation signal transduction histidine kinase
MVRLLTNPLALRSIVVLVLALGGLAIGIAIMRRLRRSIAAEAELDTTTATNLETLPLHLYNTVIQQLKQQKRDLEVQTQTEQRRARTTENFSQSVLSNLSSGVLVFGTNGLVKQSNPAAKEILGFASPSGMSAEDILRGAVVSRSDGSTAEAITPDHLADEIHSVLRGEKRKRQVEADYLTPGGVRRRIAVTISPVPAVDGALLGAACLINDLSEFEHIRRQQELHGEVSAEMALELRTSLATISGYAQQLASSRDPQLTKQLAVDIADEAARLDRSIGGFLMEKRPLETTSPRTASARA